MESPKKYPCKQCDDKFSRPSALKRHVIGMHYKVRHGCDQCKKQFVRLDTLRRHKLEQHEQHLKIQYTSGEPGTTCSKCQRDFSRVEYKVMHEKKCPGTTCIKCQRDFSRVEYKRVHEEQCNKRRIQDNGPSDALDDATPIALRISDAQKRTESYTCTYYGCGQHFDSHADFLRHACVINRALQRHLATDPPPSPKGSMQVVKWQSDYTPNAILGHGDQPLAGRRARFVPFVLPVTEPLTKETIFAFYQAFKDNDLAAVKSILRWAKKNSGLDINEFCYECEQTCLPLDSLFHKDTTTELFLEDLSAFLLALKPEQGTILLSQAFNFACRSANKFALSLLLKTKQVDVNCQDHYNCTPLMNAIGVNCETLVKALLDAERIEMNIANSEGNTALMLAVSKRSTEIVEILLRTGKVDVNIQNYYGTTSLMLAASMCSIRIVEALLRTNDVKMNMRDFRGRTPLMLAVSNCSEDIVEALLRTNKVDINMQDNRGRTPLMLAASNCSGKIVEALLRTNKVDINIQDVGGSTSLMLAVSRRCTTIVKALLRTGKLDINIQDGRGRTAIMVGISNNCPIGIIKALLNYDDVDTTIEDEYGRTVFHVAGTPEIVNALLSHRNKSNTNI